MKKIVYKREIPEIVEQTPDGEQVVIREAYLQTESLVFTESNKDIQIAEALKYAYNGEYTIEEIPDEPKTAFIPTPEESAISMMKTTFAVQVSSMDDDSIIRCSGLADEWTPGDHKVNEIYNAENQTWECFQAYDNEIFPNVIPSDPSWYTFNRPLHGKTKETARPFVPVQGSHDMYRTGEYMVYTDGKVYQCKSDTNFSPEDYSQAWEVIE